MKRWLRGFILAVSTAHLAGPLAAHHGDAGRFEDAVTTLTGVVVAVQLVNPHSSILIDVTDETGSVVRWQAELGSPSQLVNGFGWDRSTLAPGAIVQVTGRAVKSGAPFINLTETARIVLVESCEEIYHSRSLPEDSLSCS